MRKLTRREMARATMLATGALLLGSGRSRAAAATAPHYGGTLIFARTADILSLDPTQITDNESIWTAENIYETLYVTSPDGKTLKPWLATGHTLSPDHLSWTFKLRSGVLFQNGQPLNSADVKFSIERVAAKASNPFAFINTAIAGVDTPDPATVVIHTKYPWAPLLSDVALFANGILPVNYAGQSEAEFFAHPIGTGPFMVKSWSKGSAVRLTANPHYWQKGKPYLAGVTFLSVPNDNTRRLQLQSGESHIDEFPPFSMVGQLQHASGIRMELFPSTSTEFLEFNNAHKPFDDVHVRRAICYAIDREAMIKAVLFGHGKPANAIISPGLWGYDQKSPGIMYDPAMAKAELAKSSVPHGFSTTLIVGSGSSTEPLLGQIVQAELKPLGIDVSLREVDPNSEYTDIENGQYDMAFNYDNSDINDPDELISFSAMGGTTGQKTRSFFTNYNNPTVDQWAEEAERTFDRERRQALYDQIQVQVAKDAPMAFLYYSPFAYAYSTKVHGFTVYPTGNYHLEDVWLAS